MQVLERVKSMTVLTDWNSEMSAGQNFVGSGFNLFAIEKCWRKMAKSKNGKKKQRLHSHLFGLWLRLR